MNNTVFPAKAEGERWKVWTLFEDCFAQSYNIIGQYETLQPGQPHQLPED